MRGELYMMRHRLRLIISFALCSLNLAQVFCPANLTGSLSCILPGQGNIPCDDLTVTYNPTCTQNYTTRFTATYCNPNPFDLTILDTTYFRSEYKNFTFGNVSTTTISANTTGDKCLSFTRFSSLKNCDTQTWARFQLFSRSSANNCRTNVFVSLRVNPKFIFPTTRKPTSKPTVKRLSIRPTRRSSKTPTKKPTRRPTRSPTKKPTRGKSVNPTRKPSRRKSVNPTRKPSRRKSNNPSRKPTRKPSLLRGPSFRPTRRPTSSPFRVPTRPPTRLPSRKPTFAQSKKPTNKPTQKPTAVPSKKPLAPTRKPTPVKGPSRKPTRKPTMAPTSSICGMTPGARRNLLTSFVSGISPSTAQALTNSSSPHSLALSWLTNQDKRLCPGDSGITQRFIMAAFYFSTGGDSWVGCGRNSVKACSVNLTFVINDPLVARYGSSTWLSDVDECLWGGLACNNTDGSLDRIEFNRLLGNKLQGTLPAEITLLTNMRYLIIESCCSSSIPTYNTSGYAALQGTIPSNIGNLQKLFVLDLSYNLMSGTLPTSILNVPKLKELDLNYNNFVGTFPSPTTTQLSKLLYLRLENNAFTGTVPNFGNARSLVNFTLQANKFSGAMPQAICNLIKPPPGAIKNLTDLWADCAGNPPKVTCTNCCTKCF